MAHLPLVNTNALSTRVAVLGVHALKAPTAVWTTFAHDVALAAQVCVTLITGEVLHVPAPTLCFGALIREDDLKGQITNE